MIRRLVQFSRCGLAAVPRSGRRLLGRDAVAAFRLLSVAEVAELTGLSETVIYRAISARQLRATRLRGRLRVRLSDLEQWIEANMVAPRRRERRRSNRPPVPRRSGMRAGGEGHGLRELLQQET